MSLGAAAPLSGIRVLDMTSVVMGPYATQVLADLGAEVIKIEPRSGDTTRYIGVARTRGMAAGFVGMNRGKKSVALDLKRPGGCAAAMRLARTVDVLVCNLRPAAMRRLGLDYETVSQANPRLVYLSLVGYGSAGRYAGKPAYDDLIQAVVALPSLLQQSLQSEPCYVPLALCDRSVGIAAINALLAALLQRERGGEGQHVEVPMFETMAGLVLSDHLGGAAFVPQQAPMGYARLLSKHRRPFRTRDGYVAVLPYNDEQWRRFFEVAGRPGMPDADPRFRDIGLRTANIDALYQLVAELLLQKTTVEWLELLDRADIAAMPLHTLESLRQDPHLADVGFFERTEHADEGAMLAMRPAARFSAAASSPAAAAPRLGEHTWDVLRDAGLSAAELQTLSEQGVIPAAGAMERTA